MKKLYLMAIMATALLAGAQNKAAQYDQFNGDNGLVYTYDYDNWAVTYDDYEGLEWILTNGQAATGHVVIANEVNGEPVRVIGAGAFRNWETMASGNTAITGVTIPDNVEIIQMAAFLGCTNLKTIDLNNVRRIDYATFVNCDGLEEIHIRVPASVMQIGWEVFNHIDEEGSFIGEFIPATVYVPVGQLQAYIDKFCNAPEDEMFWEENALYGFYINGRLREEGDQPDPGVPGDVDGNGSVGIEDVNAVINAMLGPGAGTGADVDGNGSVGIEDVNAVINIMLGKN